MIKFFSSWAKNLGMAIVIVSILEMLLPNNKTKKYIRMVMGVFIIFNIISPLIENKNLLDINQINLESYSATETTSSEVDQTSMDKRIQELYVEQLEKDITKKVKDNGYEVVNCKVNAQITDNEDDTKITKIKLKVKKGQPKKEETKEDVENKVVTEIQKIKTIDTTVNKNKKTKEDKKEENVTKAEIQNLKKFLIEEYEVSEKCLEIN